jgi:hypothetical protein
VEATDTGLKNPETVARTIATFQGMIEATTDANRTKYDEFATTVEVAPT